ncbi:MAG: DUF7336 domain-containing protein [Fluviibacter sp.]
MNVYVVISDNRDAGTSIIGVYRHLKDAEAAIKAAIYGGYMWISEEELVEGET